MHGARSRGRNAWNRRRHLILVLGLFIASGFTATPAFAQASAPAGGVILAGTDPDVAMPYRAPPAIAVCYVDMDASGHFNIGDSAILTFQASCTGNSQNRDIRLNSWEGYPAGDLLRNAPDRGAELAEIMPEPRFYFFDADESGSLSPGDTIYLRMHNPDQDRVGISDIRVTALDDHAAGTQVRSNDEDVGRALLPLGVASERLRYVDVLGTDSFTSHDHVFLSTDTARDAAEHGDVRIWSGGTNLQYGTFLGPGAPDATGIIRKLERPVCVQNPDGTAIYRPGVALYLSPMSECTGGVRSGDIRLSTSNYGAAGTRVLQGDGDIGQTYMAFEGGRVRYLDVDNSGVYGRGDLVFVNLVAPNQAVVRAGDLLLTPTDRGAGVILGEDDELVGQGNLRDLWMFRDMVVHHPASAGAGVTAGDAFYLSTTGTGGHALPIDSLRLVASEGHPFGGPVGIETGELSGALRRGNVNVCSTTSIPGEYLPGDPVYLRLTGPCPAVVQAGLLRLVSVDDHPAFTVVRPGDSDVARAVVAPGTTPQFRYLSVGEATWSHTGRLYLNLVSPDEARVRPGDIRLTTAGEGLLPGRAVVSADADSSLQLFDLGPPNDHIGYVDADRDEQFGPADAAYFVPTSTHTYVTPLSVRLTHLSAPFSAPDVSDPTQPPGQGGTLPGTSPAPPATDMDSRDATDSPTTPGPAVAFVLVGLAATAVWWRRTRSSP
jgi:hypothetical protein